LDTPSYILDHQRELLTARLPNMAPVLAATSVTGHNICHQQRKPLKIMLK